MQSASESVSGRGNRAGSAAHQQSADNWQLNAVPQLVQRSWRGAEDAPEDAPIVMKWFRHKARRR
jgi:hypothetical protein